MSVSSTPASSTPVHVNHVVTHAPSTSHAEKEREKLEAAAFKEIESLPLGSLGSVTFPPSQKDIADAVAVDGIVPTAVCLHKIMNGTINRVFCITMDDIPPDAWE